MTAEEWRAIWKRLAQLVDQAQSKGEVNSLALVMALLREAETGEPPLEARDGWNPFLGKAVVDPEL